MRRAALAASALVVASCDPPYEAPCAVTRQEVLASEPAALNPGAVDLQRSSGRIVAAWLRRATPDGGVDPFPALDGFEAIVVGADARVVERRTILAPEELRARRGSVDAVGVGLEQGAEVVYWTKTTTTTEENGRVRTAYALEAAYGAGPVIAPDAASCTECRARVAVASFADASIAFVRIQPDVVILAPGAPLPAPRFVVVRLRRDGTSEVADAPWLAAPPAAIAGLAASDAELSVEIDEAGRLVVVTDQTAWLVTRDLALLAGPIALPAAGARPAWSAPAEPAVVWSVPPTETRAGDVFVTDGRRVDRVSRGGETLSTARGEREVGVLFESAGRTLFSALDPELRKRGGDVLVLPARDERAPTASRIVAAGGGRFGVVSFSPGVFVASEVSCAP